MADQFRISGTVFEEGTGRPLPKLQVRAYDKDRHYDDLLGTAITREDGGFEMTYTGDDFRELFEKNPDIYVVVLDQTGQETLYTSEETVRWDAGKDEFFRIEIPRGLVPDAEAKPTTEGRERVKGEGARPFLVPLAGERGEKAAGALRIESAENPLPRATLGDLGVAAEVAGEGIRSFEQHVVVIPLDERALSGIDETTVRVFRADKETGTLRPVWNSGVNTTHGFAWAKVTRPGTYVPIGLPRDRLLQELLREAARERRLSDADSPEEASKFTRDALSLFHEESPELIEAVRADLAKAEAQTIAGGLPLKDLRLGHGGHVLPLPLPRGADFKEFAERIRGLDISPGGLPEEELFYPPDAPHFSELPWPVLQDLRISDVFELSPGLAKLEISQRILDLIRYLFSKNWWMYQHDERHTGHASGWSDIRSTNVGTLIKQSETPVAGPVLTKPSIVDGYVGSSRVDLQACKLEYSIVSPK